MNGEGSAAVGHRVCGAGDLALGEARQFVVEGVSVCVAHCRDGFRAIEDRCSHENYSLSPGEFDPDACEIECPEHGSIFSLESGEPCTLPATMPVAVFGLEVRGEDVVVVSVKKGETT